MMALALAGCRADGGSDTDFGTDLTSDTYFADGDADTEPPDLGEPEQEDDFLALTPAQTSQYVFIASPTRDTLTRVDVTSNDVRTVTVGRGPAAVLAPNDDVIVVFNKIDDTVSFVDAHTLAQTTIPVRDNMNRMILSPDAAWVALFHDEDVDEFEPSSGLQSFNEVSFVDVAGQLHHPMAVGFHPKNIAFSADGLTAAVVSDDTLAMVDLTAGTLIPNVVRLSDDLVSPPPAEEVILSPNGQWAFVRQFGSGEIVVIELSTETRHRIPIGSNPTDMDLSPDGTTVAVVARISEELVLLDADDPLTGVVESIPLPTAQQLGSLAFTPDGTKAIVYTTAARVDRYALFDMSTRQMSLRGLVKPVKQVAITPTGETMLVFHTKEDVPDPDLSSPFTGRWALTMVDLTDERTNPLLLPEEPIGYANAASGDLGYFIMEGQPLLEVLHYDSLLHEEVPLKSAPVYVGVMSDDSLLDGDEPSAWASQIHTLGRISFFEPDATTLETITGFELNAAIED